MIFISRNQLNQPIRGYVNKIFEHEGNNGGKIKHYAISTSEKSKEGTKVYSTWYCMLIGEAKKKEDSIRENMPIDIWGIKLTNIAKKDESAGTWSKPYFNAYISDFEEHLYENKVSEDSPY